MALTTSEDARIRTRGIDILGQLGIPTRAFPEESLAAAVQATCDTDARVLKAAAVALGHLGHIRDARGTGALVRLAKHEDPEVRYAVAFALGGHTESDAITTLIQLAHDPVAIVRDWATFGLGAIGSVDSPEIRDALYDRLSDTDETTRYEAICGLARCSDVRVGLPLLEALKNYPENSELWRPAMNFLKLDSTAEPSAEALIEGIEEVLGRRKLCQDGDD